MPPRATKISLALGLGAVAVAVAWYSALSSIDYKAAKEYLSEPALMEKYGKLEAPFLVAFRISFTSMGKSRFTFWANTRTGREFIVVQVDKGPDPWRVSQIP